jgi:hypothetical protein
MDHNRTKICFGFKKIVADPEQTVPHLTLQRNAR